MGGNLLSEEHTEMTVEVVPRHQVPERDGYAFVADSWQRGDPFFLGYASDARAALKRLSSENSSIAIPVNKP